MSQESRARILRGLDRETPAWEYAEALKVGACDGCGEWATLRRTPETGRHECRPCWDRDTLGPADGAP